MPDAPMLLLLLLLLLMLYYDSYTIAVQLG